jgi:hypothetical protein
MSCLLLRLPSRRPELLHAVAAVVVARPRVLTSVSLPRQDFRSREVYGTWFLVSATMRRCRRLLLVGLLRWSLRFLLRPTRLALLAALGLLLNRPLTRGQFARWLARAALRSRASIETPGLRRSQTETAPRLQSEKRASSLCSTRTPVLLRGPLPLQRRCAQIRLFW